MLFILLLMTFPITEAVADNKTVLPEGFEDTGSGYNISYPVGIDIANMINDLQAEKQALLKDVERFEQILRTERNSTDKIIEQTQKTIESLNAQIDALESQIDALEELVDTLQEENVMLKKQQIRDKVTIGGVSFGTGFVLGVLAFLSIVN